MLPNFWEAKILLNNLLYVKGGKFESALRAGVPFTVEKVLHRCSVNVHWDDIHNWDVLRTSHEKVSSWEKEMILISHL